MENAKQSYNKKMRARKNTQSTGDFLPFRHYTAITNKDTQCFHLLFSDNTPKLPSKGSRSATKTFFSSGKTYGEIEKPFSRNFASYSNAQRPSGVSAIRPTREPPSQTSTSPLSIFRRPFSFRFFAQHFFNRRIFALREEILYIARKVEKLGDFNQLAKRNFARSFKPPVCRQRNPYSRRKFFLRNIPRQPHCTNIPRHRFHNLRSRSVSITHNR